MKKHSFVMKNFDLWREINTTKMINHLDDDLKTYLSPIVTISDNINDIFKQFLIKDKISNAEFEEQS